ncbi:MAG: ABC transporter ATP-binding protein [Clostridiaceae bacterium]|nr:ABC transporter ATP-binding protein [Clostridiaceae bacterium]
MALLEIRGLNVYYGNIRAIHGIDLDIEEGEITAIIGSNGAGKTTILKAISGMVNRNDSIKFDGVPLSMKPHKVIKKSRICHVPEGRQIFAGLTVEENLLLGAYNNNNKKEIKQLLEEQYDLFPRLRERKNQDAGTLSGGEQQMLAICRGLMSKPRVLLLDEPSLGLAPIIVTEVMKTIQNIRDKGITVVLVEQNAKKSLSICDYAYVVENGRIKLSGTGKEMLNNPEVVEAYLGAACE